MEEIRQYSILKNLAACKHWKSANTITAPFNSFCTAYQTNYSST